MHVGDAGVSRTDYLDSVTSNSTTRHVYIKQNIEKFNLLSTELPPTSISRSVVQRF